MRLHFGGVSMTVGPVLAILFLTSAPQPTDFGIRMVPGTGMPIGSPKPAAIAPIRRSSSSFSLAPAVDLGRRMGQVTSTHRSVAHNRAVGGAPRSYHLSARAIDIARRPGVRHAEIEAAYRNAGFQLVESIDEGDHSHFAFGRAPKASRQGFKAAEIATNWGIVYAPK